MTHLSSLDSVDVCLEMATGRVRNGEHIPVPIPVPAYIHAPIPASFPIVGKNLLIPNQDKDLIPDGASVEIFIRHFSFPFFMIPILLFGS